MNASNTGQHEMLPVVQIVVPSVGRKEMGNIQALANSITEVGLLHPLVLNTRRELIAGRRRLTAVKSLGWVTVPVRIVETLDDALLAFHAERDENNLREPLTVSEIAEFAERLEALEKPKAQERQKSGKGEGGSGGRGRKKPGGNLPQGLGGKTRDKVGAALGVSGKKVDQAKKIKARGTPELIAAADNKTLPAETAAKLADLPPETQLEVLATPNPKTAAKVALAGEREVPSAEQPIPGSVEEAREEEAPVTAPQGENPNSKRAPKQRSENLVHGDLLKRVKNYTKRLAQWKGARKKLAGKDAILVAEDELTALLNDVQHALEVEIWLTPPLTKSPVVQVSLEKSRELTDEEKVRDEKERYKVIEAAHNAITCLKKINRSPDESSVFQMVDLYLETNHPGEPPEPTPQEGERDEKQWRKALDVATEVTNELRKVQGSNFKYRAPTYQKVRQFIRDNP